MGEKGARRSLWRPAALAGMVLFVIGVSLPAHTPTSTQLYVYEHINYGGAYMAFTGDREVSDLRNYKTGGSGSPNWNDRISSFKMGRNLKVIFYEHINFQGKSLTFEGTANIASLVDAGWNDRISSFRIQTIDY